MLNSDYKIPKVSAIFLVKFDVKTGNEVIWSHSPDNIDLTGIEYKVLPSGIHEFTEDLILISHKANGKLYYGLSKFRQTYQGDESTSETDLTVENDRSKIKMYSLGILCCSDSKWKPNNFISNGFEYVNFLNEMLIKFMIDEDIKALDKIEFDNMPVKVFTNPLNELPNFFNKFGPLIFKIYKLSLLRKRILIFNLNKQDNYKLHIFNYLISILSLIPKDLKFEFTRYDDYIEPLYNICLNDMNSDFLDFNSYIATTNDDILMYQPIYDYAILVGDEAPKILSFDSVQSQKDIPLKSTFNDYSKFKIIYKQLINSQSTLNVGNNSSSSDNSSVKTSTSAANSISASILSNFNLFNYYNSQSNISYEPNWWLKSTYQISWTQFIWSAFSWFASAGQYNNQLNQVQGEPNSGGSQIDTIDLVEVVGYFHKLTKKWCYLINEFVTDSEGIVELTYQDLVDLELDPYNQYDLEFISQFIKHYWEVEEVDISSGLRFFC